MPSKPRHSNMQIVAGVTADSVHEDECVQARASTRTSITSSLHRHHPEEGTVFGVTLNTLCNVMGAGVLSLPFAMYNGSIAIALFFLAIAASFGAFAVFSLTHACEVTRKFSYTECLSFGLFPDQPLWEHQNEEELDEGIFDNNESLPRRRRRWITMGMEVIIFLNNFGALVIYSRVIADSIPPVLADFFGASGVWTTSWLWLAAPAVIFFVLSCARSMNELKWTSIVGFVTILYIVIMVIVRYFTDMTHSAGPSKDDAKVIGFDMNVFACLSAYALAFGYHFNVPYFYRELKDRRPAVMMETVKNAFPIITVCYGATGLLGYLTFGSMVASSDAEGNIVNNYDKHDIAINIGRLGLFFHFASVYPILSVCARRGLHRFICLATAHPTHKEDDNGELILRSRFEPAPGDPSTTTTRAIILEALGIVAFSTVIAAFVPGIGVAVELIGTLFGIPLMFIFPGMIGMKVFDDRIPSMQGMRNGLYRRVSIACMVTGLVFLVCSLMSFIYGLVSSN